MKARASTRFAGMQADKPVAAGRNHWLGVVSRSQVEMAPDFKPYRVNVRFSRCKEAPIKVLVEKLSFIKSKTHWGAAFRFGQLRIPASDFALIAEAMGCASLAANAL